MDSSAFVVDKTLPVDINASSNPDLLTEVTYGEFGVAPMMEKSSTGRMSPVRGRTIREYDQQMSDLKKENFDLKLRIYFMEERMKTKYDGETVIHTNIELKIEMEKYKQDLAEKQALIEKASETIDNLTTKYSEHVEKEVTQIKQQCDEAVEQANQKVADMEKEISEMQEQLHNLVDECDNQLKPELEIKDKHIKNLEANLEDRDREIVSLEDRIKDLKREVTELRSSKEKQQLQFMDELEAMSTNLSRKDRDINRLSVIVQDQTTVSGITALERSHLKDEVEDTRKMLDKLTATCEKQNKDLSARAQMIGKLEDLLRDKEKENDDVKKALDAKTTTYNRTKAVLAKMAKDAHDQDEKNQELELEIRNLKETLEKAKADAFEAELQRQKAVDERAEFEDKLEKLARTLGKREGELENFKDLLEKAQKSLHMSEAAVEALQKQLENERCRCKEKGSSETGDEDVRKLRRELDDLHAQLGEREKQYQSKCDELDTIAQRLNINVTTNTDGNNQSDMLNKILNELHAVKGFVQSERHLHIDINSHLPNGDSHHGDNTDTTTHHHTSTTHHHHTNSLPTNTCDYEVFHNQDADSHHKFPVVGKNGSRIPVRRGTSSSSVSSCPDDMVNDNNSRQVTELKAKLRNLQNKLKATEETVHCQTQKMKNYRHMLVENGLLPRSRSSSVPSGLNKLAASLPMDCKSSPGHQSLVDVERSINRSPRCRSVSPTPTSRVVQKTDNMEYNNEDVEGLTKENLKLKEQLDGYKRILKVFQGRSPSPGFEPQSMAGGPDAGPAPICSESASCLLESWLNMLDNFLTDLSQSDQEGQVHLPTSSMEVARLRRGLVEARGAIKTLSDTSLVGQDKLSEGRLSSEGRVSPDSGCSDNPLSVHNTLRESPQNSPRMNVKSPMGSPRSTSSSERSDAGSRFDRIDGNGHIVTGTQSGFVQGCDSNMEKFRHASSASSESGSARYRSPSEISSNLSYGHRDAGADPRLGSMSDYQSMEKLRCCSEFTEPKNISLSTLYSDFDKSTFSTGGQTDFTAGDSMRKTKPLMTYNQTQNGAYLDTMSQRPPTGKDIRSRFDSTFTDSFVLANDTLSDLTMNIPESGRPSLMRFDNTKLDMTMDNTLNKTSTADLKERMKSLEEIIQSYKEQIHQQQSGPNMDSLQQLLNELCNLRRLLEESMERNDHLERLLFDLNAQSQNIIQDLRIELRQKEKIIEEKEYHIEERVKIIKQNYANIANYQQESAKDRADLNSCREKIRSLEKDLQTGKSTNDQLTSVCQQLKTGLEQYKKRCEQLEGDNKSHMNAVYRYKNQVKDLEEEVKVKTASGTQVNELRSIIEALESDAQLWRENESQYKNMLAESKSQINQLSSDLKDAKNELNLLQHDFTSLKGQLEHSRDTVEEQNQHLCDKLCQIDQLNAELKEKNNILQEQDSLCRDLTSKLESVTSVNEKLSTQLEQQRLTCADYKGQIDRHNHIIKDLKDGTEKLKDELTQSIQNRKSLDDLLAEREKEMNETIRMRDKYLYNLKVTYKELRKVQKEYKESQTKFDATTSLNKTLETELSVRERLMDGKGVLLTDDDKHNMIQELLKELNLARIQMTKLIEQNESIKKKMTELVQEMMKNRESDHGSSGQSTGVNVEIHTNKSFNSDSSDLSIGGNQTWPVNSDLVDGGTGRLDVFSASLPLRESTPGGPSSKNQQQSRQSSFPYNLSEKEFRQSNTSSKQGMKDSRSDYYGTSNGNSLGVSEADLRKSTSEDTGVHSSHFSVPGPIYKQHVTDQCLMYNVNDTPKYLEGITQVRIDSDMRSLFAVGMIDHFEKLRKEAQECNVILKGLATRITERLKVLGKMSATESVEYSTLKELSYAADNMGICMTSQLSMIDCFWTSELPAPNEKGEFVNQKLINQNSSLRDEICSLRSKLESLNRDKEQEIARSLESTLKVMTRARQNFQHNLSNS